jgi:hypothetical protein
MNELCLCKTNKFGNPLLLVVVVAKYALGGSFASRMLHLEVEEVFKSYKEGSNLPPSQRGICTNMTMLIFLILEWTQLPLASPLDHVMVVLCPLLDPTVGFQSLCTMVVKFVENTCGHGVWRIECYPPKSNHQSIVFQKDIDHECKMKMISSK